MAAPGEERDLRSGCRRTIKRKKHNYIRPDLIYNIDHRIYDTYRERDKWIFSQSGCKVDTHTHQANRKVCGADLDRPVHLKSGLDNKYR